MESNTRSPQEPGRPGAGQPGGGQPGAGQPGGGPRAFGQLAPPASAPTTPAGATTPAGSAGAVEPPGPEELVACVEALRAAEALLAKAVLLAGRLASSGVAEWVEGLPLELFLGLAARLPDADRRQLVGAGEVLAGMPAASRLFAAGALSWGQVRVLARELRRLPVAARRTVDARLAATAAGRPGGLGEFDPDGLIEAIRVAAADARGARANERVETRRHDSSFLSLQSDLHGGVRVYGELRDPVQAATVINALDAKAGLPRPNPDDQPKHTNATADTSNSDGDGDGDGNGDGEADADAAAGRGSGWCGPGRGRAYAQALVGLAADWLGGDVEQRRPARPSVIVHVDLAQTAGLEGGRVELNVLGGLPSITARTLEALAVDADLRVVLFDGARPLAVSAKRKAARIPADVRLSVRARDGGDRFPGSISPIGHTELHHTRPRDRQGRKDHLPEHLASLSRRSHTTTHRHGWRLVLDPVSGKLTITRRRRSWTSLPRGTPLHPPDPPRGDPPRGGRAGPAGGASPPGTPPLSPAPLPAPAGDAHLWPF